MLHDQPRLRPTSLALAVGTLFLSGCGGGGGANVAPRAPVASPAATGTATLSITVPSGTPLTTPRGKARRPAFVSPGTQKVTVYINGSATAAATVSLPAPTGSPATYQITVNAPYGTDTFRVDLLDAAFLPLATGTSAPTNVVAGTPTNVDITALGIPASAVFQPSDASTRPPYGTAASIPLNLVLTDGDGYPITGTYSQPVRIDLSPGQGGIGYSLSSTTVASSSDASALVLNYDGNSTQAPVRVSAYTNASINLPRFNVGTVILRAGALPTGTAVLTAYNVGPSVSGLNRVLTSTYASNVITTFTKNVTALATAPDGREAYIGFADGTIGIYRGATSTIAGTVSSGGNSVIALTFTDAGSSDLAYALVKAGSFFGVVQFTFDSRSAPTVLLPAAATGCTGIAARNTNLDQGRVTVSCSDATYRVDTPFVGSAPAAVPVAPGSGGGAIVEPMDPSLVLAANPAGNVAVFQAGALTPVGTITAPTGANGLATDPSQRFLYVGATGSIATVRMMPDGSGTVIKSLAVPGAITALADFPGSSGARPDATVWGADSNGSLIVVDTATNTIKQTVALPGVPVGLGFVP